MSCLVRIFKFNQLYWWEFSLPWLCSAWWELSTKNWGLMFWKMFFGLKRPLKVACYWTELEILQRGLLRKLASDGKEEMDLLNFSLIWREGEKGEPPRLFLYGRQTGDVMWGGVFKRGDFLGEEILWCRHGVWLQRMVSFLITFCRDGSSLKSSKLFKLVTTRIF